MKAPGNEFPFLVDSTTGHITGVKHPDGAEEGFMFMSPVAGTPVNGVRATLTSDMTNANADVALTAVNYGQEGNNINVTYLNPSANNAALTVTLTDAWSIRISLATGAGGAITSTSAQVVAAIAAYAGAAALVTGVAEGTGAGVVNAKAVAKFTGGVTCTAGVAGNSMATDANGVVYRKTSAQVWSAMNDAFSPKVKMTPEGGIAIKVTNKTGGASVKGYCVTTSDGTNNAVKLVPIDEPDCIGVFYESGIADAADAWVVIAGIADVYFWGNTTRGQLARTGLAADTGEVAGQAMAEAIPTSPFNVDKHFCEIGHVLESRTGAGLAKVVLHFN